MACVKSIIAAVQFKEKYIIRAAHVRVYLKSIMKAVR